MMELTGDGLRAALHLTARVQPGNRIEITAAELKEGQEVDVFLIPRPQDAKPRHSVLELLDSFPSGPRSASTWDEIEQQFTGLTDRSDVILLRGIELGFSQHSRHAEHAVQRRAQFVRQRREQRGLGA